MDPVVCARVTNALLHTLPKGGIRGAWRSSGVMGSGFAGRDSEGQRQYRGPVTKVLKQVWVSQVESVQPKRTPSRRHHRGCEQEVRGGPKGSKVEAGIS